MNWPYQFEGPVFKCPKCGSGMENMFPADSAFYRLMCEKADCSYYGVSFLVEKATKCVITASAMGDDNGEPIWPANWVNRAGECVVRGGKPVSARKEWPTDAELEAKGLRKRTSGNEIPVPGRATPRFDPADLVYAKMKAATENMARQADLVGQAQQDARVYPEVIEKLVAEIINGSSSVKEALYHAYLSGMQSERASKMAQLEANKLYAERMEK